MTEKTQDHNGSGPKSPPILFRNLAQREQAAVRDLELRRDQLEQVKTVRGLGQDEEDELHRIVALLALRADSGPYLKDPHLCDPLFVAVRTLFAASPALLDNLTLTQAEKKRGELRLQGSDGSPCANQRALIRAALVLGFIELERAALPPVQLHDASSPSARNVQTAPVTEHPAWPKLSQAFFTALGEAQVAEELAPAVLRILAEEGNADKRDHYAGVVSTLEFARVMRGLLAKGVTKDYGQLRRAVNLELNTIQAVGDDVPLHEGTISIPDLDAQVDNNIQADNVRLMGSMICAAMLEELKLWDVMDVVLRDFRNGTLTVRRSTAATKIYNWWKDAPNRMSEHERRQFLSLTLGLPGGAPEGRFNREFNDLFVRFVSSVSALVRQHQVDSMLRSSTPVAIGQQRVRKCARDLCVNLSLYGYGMAYYAALEFNKQVNVILDVLQSEDVRANYGGARDWSQVVDEIATLELGGARNSARYRTLASCGGIITAWLAKKVQLINRPTGNLINLLELTNGMPVTSSEPTKDPTDYDLWNACELWADETALSMGDREELAEKPRLSPQAPSRPIQVPAAARDLLEQAGIAFGAPSNGYARY